MAKKKDVGKKLALGALLAGITGFIAGILTAPKSGKETREDIKEVTKDGIAEVEKRLKKLHTDLAEVIKEAQEKVKKTNVKLKKDADELITKAIEAKEKARQILTAVHEGQSSDEDLEKSLKNIEEAFHHLEEFIKK